MTKSEAIRVMRSGQSVSHPLLTQHAVQVTITDGMYVTNCPLYREPRKETSTEFWGTRRDDRWSQDWFTVV